MNFFSIPTPSYVLEKEALIRNLEILDSVQKESGARILLALKGFAFWRSFEWASSFLAGTTASGIHEARLGFEEFGGRESGKEICVFSPAYKEAEIDALLPIATHLIFNSFAQWQKFKDKIAGKNRHLESLGLKEVQVGLRINPLYSEVTPPIYNPCISQSRLGITPQEFAKGVEKYGLEGISGLHFHTHCEQDSDALKRTLEPVIKYFDFALSGMKWVNFGGGHHITKKGYNLGLLNRVILDFKARYPGIEVFLEPGEAVGWQSGFLLAEVLDIVENEGKIAILDTSATAHMPDCLEMPYRPSVKKLSLEGDEVSVQPDLGENVGPYAYRLGGISCLAGDVIGDYSFDSELKVGDRILFEDMMHYTIVKNTTFNGIILPSLGVIENGRFKLLRQFDYLDYKNRNG